jgi:hypothetical protein
MAESLQPVRQSLYPTLPNLDACVNAITTQLPITDTNHLTAALMTYQNTLIQEINRSFHVDESMLGHIEKFKLDEDTPTLHEQVFAESYNKAIDHVVSYFENRLDK